MKRKVIALFVASMMALSLVPMMAMPALAATATATGLAAPPNLQINAAGQAIGDVIITEARTAALANGTTVTVALPSGVTFTGNAAQTVAVVTGATGYAAVGNVTTPIVAAGADQVIATVIAASAGGPGTIVFPGATFLVNLDSTVAPGDVMATISSSGGQVSGQVKIGTAVNASTTSTCITSPLPNVLAGLNNQAVGQLRIAENVLGVLSAGNTITVTAPAGTSFTAAPTAAVTTVNGAPGALTLTALAGVLSNANRVATWTVAVASTNRSRVTITAATSRLDVGTAVSAGEIKFTVGGTDPDIQAQDVAIANVTTLGTVNTCTTSPIPNLTVGGGAQAVGNMRIQENAAGSLVGSGRFITLTAPDNVVFTAVPGVVIGEGNLVTGAATLSVDGKVATITVTTASTTRSRIDITMPTMTPNGDALPGDLNIAIGGTAGATAGAVKVGLLRLPAAITAASRPSIKLGDQGAAVGNLTVTENFAGALAGPINIVLPSGLEWNSVLPTVTVSGNMIIGTPVRAATNYPNDTLSIPVTAVSVGSPSTLTITAIKYNVQTGAVQGSINAKLQNSNQMKAVNANLVAGVSQATFVIGQASYTANGITYVMDAKAYTKAGRTFVPVRYLAYAMGITESGVAWDAATKTVTLTKGTTVVKLVIGSKTLDKNGVATTMDVAPETVAGRTMLPARFVAEAFGGNVDWNSATQTVYVTYL